MSYHSSMGRVQSKECYFLFTHTFLEFFVVFHQKELCFFSFFFFFDDSSNFGNRGLLDNYVTLKLSFFDPPNSPITLPPLSFIFKPLKQFARFKWKITKIEFESLISMNCLARKWSQVQTVRKNTMTIETSELTINALCYWNPDHFTTVQKKVYDFSLPWRYRLSWSTSLVFRHVTSRKTLRPTHPVGVT